jgi:exopolysaccharide production protein ExoY
MRVHHCDLQSQLHSAGRQDGALVKNPLPLWKRSLDIALVVFAAPAWLPLMAVIALLIRLSSSGPVLFRQERVGLHRRRFMCLKFRTMRQDAETRRHRAYLESLIESDAPMKKLDSEDDRVLPIAGLLRASGLDELPQIFNILRGEMSIVGPRPCLPYEFAHYREEHYGRFEAVPGLTGLWQVSGKNDVSFQQMIELDVQYARQLSLRQDLSIIFRTVPVLFTSVAEASQRKVGRRSLITPISDPGTKLVS